MELVFLSYSPFRGWAKIPKVELGKEVTHYQGHMMTIEDVFRSTSVQDIPNQNSVEDAAYMIYTSDPLEVQKEHD